VQEPTRETNSHISECAFQCPVENEYMSRQKIQNTNGVMMIPHVGSVLIFVFKTRKMHDKIHADNF
jgi:hypothetical protein